jgi:hypothetical protein
MEPRSALFRSPTLPVYTPRVCVCFHVMLLWCGPADCPFNPQVSVMQRASCHPLQSRPTSSIPVPQLWQSQICSSCSSILSLQESCPSGLTQTRDSWRWRAFHSAQCSCNHEAGEQSQVPSSSLLLTAARCSTVHTACSSFNHSLFEGCVGYSGLRSLHRKRLWTFPHRVLGECSCISLEIESQARNWWGVCKHSDVCLLETVVPQIRSLLLPII